MKFLFLFITLLFFGCSYKKPPQIRYVVKTPINIYYRFSKRLPANDLNIHIKRAHKLPWQERIAYLSALFLDTPYTLVQRNHYPKAKGLIIQLDGVDCMSYVEYIEALARSKSLREFPKKLRFVRYRNGIVDDGAKRHFFTDWIENGYGNIAPLIAPNKAKEVRKLLNADRQIAAVAPFWRTFSYIPSHAFDEKLFSRLQTGDIVGAYAAKPSQHWLDVTHMGIIIVKDGIPYFRNASSLRRYNKVVDIPLQDYLKRVPGILVLRKTQRKTASSR
jgi:hypothetical protein